MAKKKTTKLLVARRVFYGSTKTPKKDREYFVRLGGPVGTKAEWKNWAKTNKCKIKFVESEMQKERNKFEKINKKLLAEGAYGNEGEFKKWQ